MINTEFLIYPVQLQKALKLTDLETKIYAFVKGWLTHSTDKFYFSNTQIANLFDVSETSISLAFKKLKQVDLLELGYRIKTNGGKVRFVQLSETSKFKFNYTESPSLSKLKGINNKISNNKINNIYNPSLNETKLKDKVSKGKLAEANYAQFISKLNELTHRRFTTNDKKGLKQYTYLISKGYSLEDGMRVIAAAYSDEYHISTKYKYLTPEFLTRTDKWEKYLNVDNSISKVDVKVPERELTKEEKQRQLWEEVNKSLGKF